ncbi:putative amidoligase domain-containing protein [Paenibacillus sp. HW567]|uniref:putative amidoligase domain-containing protein n=1 Tax=Paenibacillus sp. HW567 TaxID=1034769 RepID=UPI00037A55E7|nr:hypothetical protein [Paenibacillus sp. HW567]
MNEGYETYRQLSIKQREHRLRRSGLEASLTPAGKGVNETATYGSHRAADNYRQCYRIRVFGLAVLEILPLGTGAAMEAAALTARSALSEGGERARAEVQNGVRESVRGTERAGDAGERRGTVKIKACEGAAVENGSRVSGGGEVEPGTMRAGDVRERRGVAKIMQGIAVRALYSLGLDSGDVLLKAMGERRYIVLALTPLRAAAGQPLPAPYQAAALALGRDLALEQPGRTGLLMGMDPEFLLLRESTGRVVPASRYLPLDGVAGCDAGPPGTRGAFPVAELRPAPRGEPRALLAQLMSAARTADRLIADRSLRWRAGGMPLRGWALGGHLHFSGVTLTAPLLRALDNYLALPLLLLEDARASARRPRYGVLGDFRIQPHGGFEYRTLPSFLVSPVIAKGAVFLAHLIVSRYEDLTLRPLDREDLHAAYYSGDKPPLRAAFLPLAAQLRALPGYAQAERYIEPLLRGIAAGQTWDESRDIRELWCSDNQP